MMHVLILNSTLEILATLREHLEFVPSERRLQLTEVDNTLEDPRPADSPQVTKNVHENCKQFNKRPFFTVTINIGGPCLRTGGSSFRSLAKGNGRHFQSDNGLMGRTNQSS